MKKLQKTLNEAIKMGWNPWGDSYCYYDINQKQLDRHIICDEYGVGIEQSPESDNFLNYSYHELFSKDSGIIEFMDWNNKSDRKIPEIDKYVIRYLYDPDFVYKKMGPMTTKEKIDYFNTNAILPKGNSMKY